MPANKPYVIGLTGGIGCGKSDAAAHLSSLGAVRVDADAISRALTAPGGAALEGIRRAFGDGVFLPDGALDRTKLADLVFPDEAARRALEGILHPMIQAKALEEIDQAQRDGAPVVVLEVPLLFETGMDVLCDEVWTVTAPHEVQLARVTARGLTVEQAEARIASQMSPQERARRARHVISTDRSPEKTRAELSDLYRQALKSAGRAG